MADAYVDVSEFQSIERRRYSEFISYLDAYDPEAITSDSFSARWRKLVKHLNGERAYSAEEITQEAIALENCLLGKETQLDRALRFFQIR